jgi:hypothetical protein
MILSISLVLMKISKTVPIFSMGPEKWQATATVPIVFKSLLRPQPDNCIVPITFIPAHILPTGQLIESFYV